MRQKGRDAVLGTKQYTVLRLPQKRYLRNHELKKHHKQFHHQSAKFATQTDLLTPRSPKKEEEEEGAVGGVVEHETPKSERDR